MNLLRAFAIWLLKKLSFSSFSMIMRNKELLGGFSTLWIEDSLKLVKECGCACNETKKCCGECLLEG